MASSKAAFRSLEAESAGMRDLFGRPLTRETLPEARASRVCAWMPEALGADHLNPIPQDEELIDTAPRSIRVLRPHADRVSPTAEA